MIVGLAAGGPTDANARIIAQWLSEHMGQQFAVENRTGAAGSLATEAVINASPDGYTILFAGPNVTIGASLFKRVSNVLEAPGGPGGFGGSPKALSARDALDMATRGGAALLGRNDIGMLAPGMSADFIAVSLNQLGLSGTQRDPLAALIMCGPFKVDYSFINGRKIIGRGNFIDFDVERALASHSAVMDRIYQH